MAACLLVSELLCYLLNKYGNVQIEALKKVILSFYSGKEISAAKELLFKTVFELSEDQTSGLPRNVNRRKSDSRAATELDDIVGLIDAVDEKQLLTKLPEFVARKPERLPPFRADELDLCLAVRRIAELEEKVSFVATQCVQLATMVSDMKMTMSSNSLGAAINLLGSAGPGVGDSIRPIPSSGTQGSVTVPSNVSSDSQASTSWADMAGSVSFDPVDPVGQRRAPVQPPSTRPTLAPVVRGAKLTGSGKGQTAIRGVPRRINAFAGRLHKDTTEDELHDLLISAGVMDAQCKKLEAKNGREFSTAAFRVSCSITWSDAFYRSETWPAGAEVRDWVFYDRKQNNQQHS
jgi:hypothetical protein